jgi:hypothetical protein
MVKLFRALVFRHRLKKQIRLADERKRRTGKKQFVINLGGRCACRRSTSGGWQPKGFIGLA